MMGIYNIESAFPTETDDLYFISDVSLETHDIYKHHKQLISEGRYSEASEYLNQQTGITPANADFFNMLENRIYNTQIYVSAKEKVNPVFHSDISEADDISKAPIWVSAQKL